jgi:uncharacterized protein YciI
MISRTPSDRIVRRLSAKRILSLMLWSAAILFGSIAIPRAIAGPGEPPAKNTFLIIYRPGPAWLPGKSVSEQPLKEHGKYMLSLYTKGALKFAGPFTDNAGGAVVLELASESDAKTIVTEDPAVKTGLFLYELHPWGLVSWEKYVKKPK